VLNDIWFDIKHTHIDITKFNYRSREGFFLNWPVSLCSTLYCITWSKIQ